MAKFAIVYSLNGVAHQVAFRQKEYDWGLWSVDGTAAQATRFTTWTDKLKTLCTNQVQFQGLRYINNSNAVVNEYIAPTPVAGTFSPAASAISQSMAIGFGFIGRPVGTTGKAKKQTYHVFCGHSEYAYPGTKVFSRADWSALDTFMTWLPTAINVVGADGRNMLMRNYATQQFFANIQQKYGR